MTFFFYYKSHFVTALLLVFYLMASYAHNGRYPIQNFSPTEYRAGIQNIDFAQNRDMTLFVANNLGVLSFNGNDWEIHNINAGKKKRSLAFDEERNRLYVGAQGEFGYFTANWEYQSLRDLIPEAAGNFDEVWDVYTIRSMVYFCTFRGIYAYDGQSIGLLEYEGGLERSFQTDGKLFSQSRQGQLLELKEGRLIPVYQQQVKGEIIAGIIPVGEGYLIVYNSGLTELINTFEPTDRYEILNRALRGTYVNHVLALSDSRMVIATQTAGLFLYDLQQHTLENISVKDGLATNACLRTFQDYAGNLWVGMQNGMAMVHINSPMRLINREISLQGSGYDAHEAEDGTYFTTANGIYFLGKDQEQCKFIKGTEGPAYGMQRIAGKLYAGHHTGLFQLENGSAAKVVQTDGMWQIKQLRSHPGFAIGGTYSGLFLFRITPQRELEAVQAIDGFQASSRFFEEDRRGRIWVGQYYQGLYELTLSADLTQATVQHVSHDSDLPIHEQIVLSKVDESLYLATNAGLYQLDPGTGIITDSTVFSEAIGHQPIYLFEQDNNNNVHVVAENTVGFFRQISSQNYQFVPSSLYQLRYQMNNDLLHIARQHENGVLFSANEGFIQYDPELEFPAHNDKTLVIAQVFSVTEDRILYQREPFGQKTDEITPLIIQAKDRFLKIDVECFQFDDLGNQEFRYFLKGFDDDYGAWTNATTKEYTNLREGQYEFTAQVRNALGVFNTSQILYLTVQPPLYRSLVAKLFYVALGVSLLVLITRFQKRRYRHKTEQLEAAKKLELARKQQKLVEMEQQNELELLQLKEEKMHSELEHVNNLLAASTMNLVVKNEFIEAIRKELKEVKQKGRNQETKQALEKIVKEIDIRLRLQEDWEQFEYHFDRVHGDFLTRLRHNFPDLSPNEQKLCVFLRLNLNTKEIANLLSISLRGVEVARYRLRKKLELETGQNLSKFILEY